MCGRMAITLPPEAMAQLFNATPANDLPPLPNYNVCPTVNIPTVTSDSGTRHLRAMRWGFLPRWYKKLTGGPLLINARSETIAEKPAFREACRHRIVRRQSFWNQRRLKLRESLAHLVGIIMRRAGGDASVAFRVSFV